jgi:hypothetical protein
MNNKKGNQSMCHAFQYCRLNVLYVCCPICYEMSENIDESEEAQEKKAIPREPTEVSGAKESKGIE